MSWRAMLGFLLCALVLASNWLITTRRPFAVTGVLGRPDSNAGNDAPIVRIMRETWYVAWSFGHASQVIVFLPPRWFRMTPLRAENHSAAQVR